MDVIDHLCATDGEHIKRKYGFKFICMNASVKVFFDSERPNQSTSNKICYGYHRNRLCAALVRSFCFCVFHMSALKCAQSACIRICVCMCVCVHSFWTNIEFRDGTCENRRHERRSIKTKVMMNWANRIMWWFYMCSSASAREGCLIDACSIHDDEYRVGHYVLVCCTVVYPFECARACSRFWYNFECMHFLLPICMHDDDGGVGRGGWPAVAESAHLHHRSIADRRIERKCADAMCTRDGHLLCKEEKLCNPRI